MLLCWSSKWLVGTGRPMRDPSVHKFRGGDCHQRCSQHLAESGTLSGGHIPGGVWRRCFPMPARRACYALIAISPAVAMRLRGHLGPVHAGVTDWALIPNIMTPTASTASVAIISPRRATCSGLAHMIGNAVYTPIDAAGYQSFQAAEPSHRCRSHNQAAHSLGSVTVGECSQACHLPSRS